MKELVAIAGLMFLLFGVIIFIDYGQRAIAVSDAQVNLTDSAYNATYNSQQQTAIVSFSLIQYLPWIILVVLFIVLIIFMANKFGVN